MPSDLDAAGRRYQIMFSPIICFRSRSLSISMQSSMLFYRYFKLLVTFDWVSEAQ